MGLIDLGVTNTEWTSEESVDSHHNLCTAPKECLFEMKILFWHIFWS